MQPLLFLCKEFHPLQAESELEPRGARKYSTWPMEGQTLQLLASLSSWTGLFPDIIIFWDKMTFQTLKSTTFQIQYEVVCSLSSVKVKVDESLPG